ncbi:MAG: ribonuclease D [Micavibrio sp.]|nr:ribonuclease D [Micavibrio sp.]
MLIKTQDELNNRIAALKKCEFITVDTEFLREKTYYSKLCLIQISGPDKDAFAIDTIEYDFDLDPLFDLFTDKKVLKIFHAARNDLEIFYQIMDGRLPAPVFDTQIAAMVCGYGDSVGYESLVRDITGEGLDKSVQYTNWSHRPLSDRQLDYALGDVTHLVDVYRHLQSQLDKKSRTKWAFEEEEVMTNPETYAIDPTQSWQRVKIRSPKPKNLAVLREIAAWREREAQRRNMPRAWVLRDETLADIAGQIPKKIGALKKIRNIPGDYERSGVGAAIMKAIETAMSSDPSTWPKIVKKRSLTPSAAAGVDILKMLLKVQAAQSGVAAKLIASSDDLENFVNGQGAVSFMKGWRYELFGKEAEALNKGELAIGLKKGRIVKFKIDQNAEVEE